MSKPTINSRIARGEIIVISHNCMRSSSAQTNLLAHVYDIADIVFLQEPWYHSRGAERKSLSHPSFEALIPHGQGNKFRVMMYSNKARTDLDLSILDSHFADQDVQHIEIRAKYAPSFTITNVYNEQAGDSAMFTLDRIQDKLHSLGNNAVILGDFNAHHSVWDEHATTSVRSGIVLQLVEDGFEILNDETPTRMGHRNQRDSIIDLTMVRGQVASKIEDWVVLTDMATGSDHLPIGFGIILGSGPGPTREGRRNFKTLDEEGWRKVNVLLGSKLGVEENNIALLDNLKTPEALEAIDEILN